MCICYVLLAGVGAERGHSQGEWPQLRSRAMPLSEISEGIGASVLCAVVAHSRVCDIV